MHGPAVYWPALLLSAGLPLPTRIYVHPYLTVDGAKISKSTGNSPDPVELVTRYGADSLRWWCCRDVPPAADADFTAARVVGRANEDLANTVGNLAARVRALSRHCSTSSHQPPLVAASEDLELLRQTDALTRDVVARIASFELRAAAQEIVELCLAANSYVESVRPWELARHADRGAASAARLESVLGVLEHVVSTIGDALAPFVPETSARVRAGTVPAFARLDQEVIGQRLQQP